MKKEVIAHRTKLASLNTPQRDGKFRKSTMSGGGDCVEVAKYADGSVQVRDSKVPKGPILTFTSSEWRAFLAGAQSGEFDI